MLQRAVQVQRVGLLENVGEQGADRLLDVADDAEVDRAAVSERLRPDVDLQDTRMLRVERAVGKVRSQKEERVTALHRLVAGGEAHQAGHADVVRVVVFEVLLAAECVHDRRLQLRGELHDLVVRAGTPGSAKHRHALARVQHRRQLREVVSVGYLHGLVREQPIGDLRLQRLERDIPRHHHDRDTALGDGDAHGTIQDLRQLLRPRDQFDIVAALLEQDLGVRRLEVVDADLRAGDVRGDRQHGDAVALAIEQPVDQVQVARAATAGADGESAGDVRLGAGSEGRALLVSHVDPFDVAVHAAQRVRETVERIADNAIDALDARLAQGFGHVGGRGSRHDGNLPRLDWWAGRIRPLVRAFAGR